MLVGPPDSVLHLINTEPYQLPSILFPLLLDILKGKLLFPLPLVERWRPLVESSLPHPAGGMMAALTVEPCRGHDGGPLVETEKGGMMAALD